jgi:hypothetical protein
MYVRCSVKYELLMKLEFSGQIFEKKKCSDVKIEWKIRPVGAELYRTDGQTDMTKLIVPFRNFANAHKKNSPLCPQSVFIYSV